MTDTGAGTPLTAEERIGRYLDELEAAADETIDGGRPINAPWVVSVVREVRATLARSRPATDPAGLDENPWAQRLLAAESENHCGDAGCQTRRTAAAVAVLTGWKEHTDLAWAVEVFQVEIGVRDPALVGKEPENVPSRGAIEAEAFARGEAAARLSVADGPGPEERPDLEAAARAYVAVRDHEDIEGHEAVLSYAADEWRAFEQLRAALPVEETGRS